MKLFRFRLARLMHLKQAEKKQRAIELAHEQSLMRQCEAQLEDSRQEWAEVAESYAALSARPSVARQWDGALLALGAAKQEVLRRTDLVRRASERVEQARERLVKKSREAETLERLRQRRWREYSLENLRDEQKENDAKAVTRFLRDRDPAEQHT
jgi:flagellar export protein FliJ